MTGILILLPSMPQHHAPAHLPAAHRKMHPSGKKLSLPLVAQPKYSKMN